MRPWLTPNAPSLSRAVRAKIAREDLKFVSLYNTYLNGGWTPTPIANPGLEAIEAALSPQSSGYLYYLSARGSQKIIFSKTLDEHNDNRVKYL